MSGLTKANPLQALIQQASKLPPTTGVSAQYRARLTSGGSTQVVLADVSSSMDESAGVRRKIDVLRDALDASLGSATLIAFASLPTVITSPQDLPLPEGGTALHLALDAAAAYRPARTLVISDGVPEDERAALAAADRLTGAIDVIYCGPDSARDAIAFLRQLARVGCGRYAATSLKPTAPLLAPTIQRLLLGDGK
jgi:hypothetical protein